MKSPKIQFFAVSICVIFGVSVLAGSAVARPIEPLTYDYAEFRYDPYPEGTYTMTIYYRHDSYCNMYIYLYNPNDYKVKTWVVDRYSRSGYRYYTGNMHGVWRLQCYMSGYLPYWTDAALFHKFSVPDPAPEQNNLGSDWARHPQNSDIYEKALEIIGQTTSVRTAAQNIYYHVRDHFVHTTSYLTFRSDLELLDDLNTYGQYRGVCRSDAVILTAYARAVGIPARIIHLTFYEYTGMLPPPSEDPHYHAEFYIENPFEYEWVPVDGDYEYFGITEANKVISCCWPRHKGVNPYSQGYFYLTSTTIVTHIPRGGLVDSGFTEVEYPEPVPYTNTIPCEW